MEKISGKKLVGVVFRTIRLIIKANPIAFFIGGFFTVAMAVAGYLQIVVFSNIINGIVQKISDHTTVGINSFLQPLSILFILFLIPNIFSSIRELIDTKIREHLIVSLQILRANRFSKLDIATVESTFFQSTIQRLSDWGLGAIQNMYGLYVSALATTASVILAVILLGRIDYRLVVLAIISSIPIYFIDSKFSRELFNLRYFDTGNRRVAQDRFAHFATPRLLIDVIQNKMADIFIAEGSEKYASNRERTIHVQSKKTVYEVIFALFVALCSILGIYLIIHLTVSGLITVGALFVAYSSYASFRAAISSFLENISAFQESGRYAGDWFMLMDIQSKLPETKNPVRIDSNAPLNIVFENVSFKYPEKEEYTLQNLNFEITPKQKVAFVGHNGAGKTTLIRLLTRVYDPSEGRILVNGVDLKDISIHNWRDCVAVMQQDFVNYNLTARRAITIAQQGHELDEERMIRAAELSGSDDFINEFPKKYDQLIWKGFQDGVDLSRGQFQRLAVARTFYRNSSLCIFDEPTSAIDALAEERIFNAIETQMKDKTVALISHRFSTVKNVDNIIFLEHGKIIEMGNHQELMTKKGKYQELFTMQANRYLDEE